MREAEEEGEKEGILRDERVLCVEGQRHKTQKGIKDDKQTGEWSARLYRIGELAQSAGRF